MQVFRPRRGCQELLRHEGEEQRLQRRRKHQHEEVRGVADLPPAEARAHTAHRRVVLQKDVAHKRGVLPPEVAQALHVQQHHRRQGPHGGRIHVGIVLLRLPLLVQGLLDGLGPLRLPAPVVLLGLDPPGEVQGPRAAAGPVAQELALELHPHDAFLVQGHEVRVVEGLGPLLQRLKKNLHRM